MDKIAFKQVVRSSKLGERKAYYLIQIDRAFSKIPAPKSRLKRIGWTKLRTLSPYITRENYGALLKNAEALTDKKLEALLLGKPVDEPTKAVLMYLTETENAQFEGALALFGGVRSKRGMSNREEAVMAMARWVLANKPGT